MFSGTYTATVGSETTVFECIPPGPGKLTGYISLQNLASGDSITFREYITVDGSNYVLVDTIGIVYDSSMSKVVKIEEMLLSRTCKLKVTGQQHTGTARDFPWVYGVSA